MKRIVCIGIALLLLLAAAGCATTNPAPTASPIITAGGASPDVSMMPATSPDTTGGTGGGTAGGAGTTIPDYAEGTEVMEADVPEVKAALQDMYEGATISRITQGMQGTQQVYVVEYTTQDGKTETAYIAPGGAFITPAPGGTNSSSTANPGASASPGAAASPAA